MNYESASVGMHPGASAKIISEINPTNVGMHPGASAKILSNVHTSNVGMHPGASVLSTRNVLPVRKNIRADFHDYSCGEYFVTICTLEKKHYFGKIENGTMDFSELGNYAYEAMESLQTHYNYVEVPMFVVMPNHIHAIICIKENTDAPGCIPTIRTALGVVVGGFKQSVTRFARRNNIKFWWQKRYHDHIIRNYNVRNKIAEYIDNNIIRWESDCFYSS